MLLSAVYLFLLLALPTTAGDGNQSSIDDAFVDNATGSTTAPGSPEWKAEGDLQLLTGDLPAGYSGKLTSQDGRYSCQLGPDVAVSEYLVKDAGGNVTFSIFLKDPTKVLEKEPIVVQVDFGSTGKLNICFYNIIGGLAAYFCPDGAVPVLLVPGSPTTPTFQIVIFDDGRVQSNTKGKMPNDSPMFGKLVGRPLSATDNATAVKFSMTVLNATTEVFLQLSHRAVATMVQNQKDVPAESSFPLWAIIVCACGGAAAVLVGIIVAIVCVVRRVRKVKAAWADEEMTRLKTRQADSDTTKPPSKVSTGPRTINLEVEQPNEKPKHAPVPALSVQPTQPSDSTLPVCTTQEAERTKSKSIPWPVCPTEQTPAEEGRSRMSLCQTQEMPVDAPSDAYALCPTQEMAVEGRSATLKVADTQMSAVKGIKSSSLQVDATQAVDAPDDAVVRAKSSVLQFYDVEDPASEAKVKKAKSREKRTKTSDGNTQEGKKKRKRKTKSKDEKKTKEEKSPEKKKRKKKKKKKKKDE